MVENGTSELLLAPPTAPSVTRDLNPPHRASFAVPVLAPKPRNPPPKPRPSGSKPPQANRSGSQQTRRGKNSSRKRGGQGRRDTAHQKAEVTDQSRLRDSWLSRCQAFFTTDYSILTKGCVSSTGWHGRMPARRARAEIVKAYHSGAIFEELSHFFPIYHSRDRPSILLGSDLRILLYQTAVVDWLEAEGPALYDACQKLVALSLANPKVQKSYSAGERGQHLACIIGHYRQYSKAPTLTLWHKQNQRRVDDFLKTPIVVRLNNFVSSVVKLMFPGVAERFLRSAEWHEAQHGIKPLFGLFWNLCYNGMFAGQTRIHCSPHADSKNIVGVCVLVIYQIPNKRFNHSRRSWLVLWDAGVAIQMPPWTMVAFPSSLLYHFNIDISEFTFVTTEGNARPTPGNSVPIQEGDGDGRGSIVYFNQASMYQSSETGCSTLKEAEKKGIPCKANFPASVEEALLQFGKYFSIDKAAALNEEN
ncbi:hypothetical protein BDN70DRAFT_819685 [Pholiota conissans]|uniref:Uncharacterized protein n=1 Tax=Pholiota conissans TaxID=109636 RepID=A0A9P5YKU4_9AGAR|nr:hypothetical protein BDN70DRAFT_819685 [Pholiota conissans]